MGSLYTNPRNNARNLKELKENPRDKYAACFIHPSCADGAIPNQPMRRTMCSVHMHIHALGSCVAAFVLPKPRSSEAAQAYINPLDQRQ